MNKRMIVLIALVVAVFAAPASAETLEVRGTIVELDADNPTLTVNTPAGDWYSGYRWDYSTFSGFWYDPDDDLKTENLTILSGLVVGDTVGPLNYPYQRTIGEGRLVYTTHPVFQEYELYIDKELTVGGDTGYYIEGWIGEKYVAIDGNADKLCEPLVEDDEMTLSTDEEWDIGGGFALEVVGIDATGKKATIHLSKNGGLLATGTLDTSGSEQDRVYTYTADIGGEDDIPVFSCYVDAVSGETDTVEIMYVFLIDDDVLEIETTQTYGAMEVMTASSMNIVLRNDEATIDLDTNSKEHIMGNMYFKTADDDVNDHIRFYPMVEYTEPGTYEVRGTIVELDAANPTLGVDRVWDYSEFAGFWYDLDADLETETLTILEGALGYPGDREIDESSLVYKTRPVFQEYQMHQDIPDPDRTTQTAMEHCFSDCLEQQTGLCVESSNSGGDCGYFIEGWMGGKYVAIDDNADKLCKLLLEFEDDDTKTLTIGEKWALGGGFALEPTSIDDDGNKVMLQLSKNGIPLEGSPKCIDTGGTRAQNRVCTYTADIGGEEDIPVFSCYADAVFKGSTSYVQLMYVFLIDDDVLEIETSQTYGAMKVKTASSAEVVLNNDATPIDLDPGTTTNITDTMYFMTANDNVNDHIRFYPFVERTIGGEEPEPTPQPGNITDTDGDGVPDVWDADNSTTPGYWVNSDGIGRMLGDMNGDGELTSVDALMILQAAANGIKL